MNLVQVKTYVTGVLRGWFTNKSALDNLSDNNGIGSYNSKKITISTSNDNMLSEDDSGIFLSQEEIISILSTAINNSDNANIISSDGFYLISSNQKLIRASNE